MNTWEVLERAAEKIERDGLCKGYQGGGDGEPNCALGAIAWANGKSLPCGIRDHVLTLPGVQELNRAMPEDIETFSGMRVAHWNNRDERTAAEVISMMRAVAATEKARAARLLPVVVERVEA
jgi:ATP:corrinoid adenosyltransferase